MKDGAYKTAAKHSARSSASIPIRSWATKAILMQAYAQYQRNAYDEAINAAKRFITLHPGHKDAAYAYYLVGAVQLRADHRCQARPDEHPEGAGSRSRR